MKRIMVRRGLGSLLVLSLLGSSVGAEPTEMLARNASSGPTITWHETLQSGWKESRRRDVPMVIFITSERCTYCDAMKRDTWCNETIRQRVSDGFVAIRLDPRHNAKTLARIKIAMYPMTLVGAPRGKVIAQRNGYQPPSAMLRLLGEAQRAPTLR